MATPKQIELIIEERDSFRQRINDSDIASNDKDIILGLLDFNNWLQMQLLEKRISISRLRSMVFGEKNSSINSATTKSNKHIKPLEIDNDITEGIEEQLDTENIAPSKPGGKLSYHDYKQCETINIKHDEYKAGYACPMACGGRLWNGLPGNIIKVTGQGFAKVTHYRLEKLRCALCGFYTSATLPTYVSNDKYDATFKSQLCVLKYYLGLPFYRLQSYQKMLGTPISDATQWSLVEEVADCVYPVFNSLLGMAAQGNLIHIDDTNVKILSNIKDNKNKKTGDRRGVFTTGIISYIEDKTIYLYLTGSKHAGENISDILSKRESINGKVQYMCDALSRNIPKAHEVTLIYCLAHARRKFVEIETFFPNECEFVIKHLSSVYKVDANAKHNNLSDIARLILHQKHSKPLMDNLYQWLSTQLEENLVEPNNSLGKAIKYTLKHWHPLTQFLRIPGAPLDNNVVEAALKIPIRIRKNSMFFKTKHGAFVGSMLLSIIQTCNAADINPVEYLTALQENKKLVFKEPKSWLPWCYKHQVVPKTADAA